MLHIKLKLKQMNGTITKLLQSKGFTFHKRYGMQFKETKRRIIQKYEEEVKDNLVDEGMMTINETINSHPYFVTTSSCNGRAILISKQHIRSKYETIFHFKTHQPKEILTITDRLPEYEGELWFLVEAPNIHIRAESITTAIELQQVALQAKLSKSKFQSIDPAIVVEILGTGSLQVPIGSNGQLLTSDKHLELILRKGMEILEVEQERLNTFYQLLQELKRGSSSS